jgi:hypothetical protein
MYSVQRTRLYMHALLPNSILGERPVDHCKIRVATMLQRRRRHCPGLLEVLRCVFNNIMYVLRSPPDSPDDRRKDLPSTIPDLMCSGSASLRAPMCGKWSRTVGLQILPPSRVVWYHHLICLLAKDSEISRVVSFHVHYNVTGWLSI